MSKILIDKDWKFIRGDEGGSLAASHAKGGAGNGITQAGSFDDSKWENVNLPHDYVIDGTPVPSRNRGEDLSAIPAMETMDSMLTVNGSLERCVSWYRKHFYISKETLGKRVFVLFDGIFRNSTVFVNGFNLGTHLSGYTPFLLDLTDFLLYGEDNVLAVRVDPVLPEGWWYEGGGIYRHVWLIDVPQIYSLPEETFIRTEINTECKTACVSLETTIHNSSDSDQEISLAYIIKTPDGTIAARAEAHGECAKNSETVLKTQVQLSDITLWDTENPALYSLEIILPEDLRWNIPFGLRTQCFDPDKGFLLNGIPLKLKGVCMHQDHGGIGVALFDGMQEYRLKKLKEMGCNALRTSHNPPTPELLDACDRLGILVMEETRILSSSKEYLEQLGSMVLRDRNHPSVILYSIGNEETQIQFKACASRIARTMKNTIHKFDDTRPITEALLLWDGNTKKTVTDVSLADPINSQVDVVGINYCISTWDDLHKHNSDKGFVITESRCFSATRGCKRSLAEGCRLSIFDMFHSNGRWAAEDEWKFVAEHDYVSGSFIWTGFDYRGEPTPYGWPAVSSQFGVFDLCGFPKDSYYYYRSWWRDEPIVYVSLYQTDEDGKYRALCFSNCEKVELYINGVSCGEQTMERNGHLIWENIDYQSGEIKAIGRIGEEDACEYSFKDTGTPTRLSAETEAVYSSADERRYIIVNIYALDSENLLAEKADTELLLGTDNCKIIGVANGDPMNHTNTKASLIRLFGGCAQVILETSEELSELTVTAVGMEPLHLCFDKDTKGRYNNF